MTNHPESSTPHEFKWLTSHTERHVQRHLEQGDLVFNARPAMAALAISLMMNEGRRTAAQEATDEVAMATLEVNGMQGQVFAARYDLGNGQEDGRDRIIVTHQQGVPTDATYGAGDIVIRAETALPDEM